MTLPATPWGFRPKRIRRVQWRDERGRFIRKDEAIRKGIRPKGKYVYLGPGGRYVPKDAYRTLMDTWKRNREEGNIVAPVRPRSAKAPPAPGDLPFKDAEGKWFWNGRPVTPARARKIIEREYRKKQQQRRPKTRKEVPTEIVRTIFNKNLWELVFFRTSPTVYDILEARGVDQAIAKMRDLRKSNVRITARVTVSLELPGEDTVRTFTRIFDAIVEKPRWKEMPERARKQFIRNVYDLGVPTVDVRMTLVYGIWSCMRELIRTIKQFIGESPTIDVMSNRDINYQFHIDRISIIQTLIE